MMQYHAYVELGLWMAGLFLVGCPLGVVARRLFDSRRQPPAGKG
jgi:hypothetical protein